MARPLTLVATLLMLTVAAFSQQDKASVAKREAARPLVFIKAPPDAKSMKDEIVKKLRESELVELVTLEDKSDFILDLMQSGKLNVFTGSGDKGAAVLRDRTSGEDVWSDSRGGGWSWRGWSNKAVGRKLGDELVKFFKLRASVVRSQH